jgi:hypothetical protein
MTTPCWVTLTSGRPRGAHARAELTGNGRWLAAWRQEERPCQGSLLADAAAFDPSGPPAWISLAWAPPGFDLLFDDPAVQRARQIVLEQEPPAAVTTFSRDASHLGGALTARRGPGAERRLRDDPFARLLPAAVLEVAGGLVGRPPPPASVVVERYGGAPWPIDRFAGDP